MECGWNFSAVGSSCVEPPPEADGSRAPSPQRRPDRARSPMLIVAGALVLALLAPLPWLGDLRYAQGPYLTLITAATLVLYLGFYLSGRRNAEPGRRIVVVVALLLRLAMLPMEPSLSDDAYRYLWDGRLLLNGVNPYLHIPADSSLVRFHDELFRLQGYPTTHTIYPPGMQVLFAASVALAEPFGAGHAGGFAAWKLLVIAADMLAIWLLVIMLERLGHSRRPALLYAWHPLAVVELAGQGHTDVFWALGLGLALYGYMMRSAGGGVPGLAIGGILRLYPLALLPLWGRFLGARMWVQGLLLSLPVFLFMLPLLDPAALDNYATVLARFTNYYEFNGGFYYAVKWMADELRLAPSNRIAGAIGTGAQLLIFLMLWLRMPRDRSMPGLAWRALLLVTAQILLGAKVHIWYFVAPLYLLPLVSRHALQRAWLWALLAAPFTYMIYTSDPPRESMTVVAIEWGGFALLAAWDFYRSRHRSANS